ncbi:hypothetical protein AAHC03_01109 [Spirometra sp. Aus1]
MRSKESRFVSNATLLLLVLLTATLIHQTAAMVNELEFQIYEEVPIGTTIADLSRAIWKDSKPPGKSWNRFKVINPEDPTSRLVEVSDNGRLLVARRIDREEICPTYGLPLLIGVDSFPDVARSLNPSSGDASRRLLLPSSKSMFGMGDEQCSFLLKVAVAQQPDSAVSAATVSTPTIPSLFPTGQDSILEIRIVVIDVNDNEPFWPNNLQSHVVEFRDGDPAGKRQSLPLAIDLDRDENAHITYSLGRDPSGYQGVEKDDDWNNLPFYLVHNPAEGLYLQTTREVDHEEASSYRLILKATDSVSKTSLDAQSPNRFRRPHTSSIPLKVVIQDINDNDPKFTRPVFMPSQPVLETTPVGSVILELTATDADSGNNGAFRFSFAPTAGWLPQVALAHHLFSVRPDGKVVVQNPLDVDRQWRIVEGGGPRKTDSIYPKQKSMEFNFKVIVRDEAEPSYARSSEAFVNIVVVDENDEAPEIKVLRSPSKECIQSLGRMSSLPDGGFQAHPGQPAYACVFENAPLDTLVATLKVNDPDFGGEDEFECNISNKNFTLLPEDFANSRLPAHQVHQVFDRPFDKAKTAGVTQYAILTAAPLDRELMPFQKIQILCSDREGHRTTQNLSILVGDVNDNKPTFLQELMHYQVPENSSPGTVLKAFVPEGSGGHGAAGGGGGDPRRNVSITTLRNVLAQDQDVGRNGRIKYLLEENSEHSGQFSIDQFSGAISTRVSFDREKTDKFTLTILAVDQGEPELTGTGTAQVTITDVNDNPPKFAQETYTFQILENMPRNSRVGQVTATDLDDPLAQGPITYYLSADHDALGFNIEVKTGEIVTRRPLDREEQPNYTFKVLARDSSGSGSGSFGHTQHTATATVNVVLEDVNDNSPVFITPNATANTLTVAVTQTLGHRLAVIHAEDADEGPNGQVTYKIKAGNSLNLFSIDSQSGLLFLAESLTRLAELHSPPLDGGGGTGKAGNASDSESESTARMLQLSTQPTVHVLTLEACDSAEEAPRCTVSTNLRIHIQPATSVLAGREEMRRYYADQQFHPVAGENPVEGAPEISGDQKTAGWGGVLGSGPRGGRGISAFAGTSSEIVIICMSVLFIILLVTILALTVFFRSCKLGPTKTLSTSATQRSLSRSKSPAYTSSMHTAELGQLTSAELVISQSLNSSGAVLTGSQSSDMILDGLRHAGAVPMRGGVSSSQSFFEMPKSMHEFSCQGLMPCPEDVRNNLTAAGTVAGHAAFQQTTIGKRQEMARSADLLYLPKGSVTLANKDGTMPQQSGQPQQPGHLIGHPYVTRNNVICFGENGEYQALRGAGLYSLEKTGADCLSQQMLRQQQPPATVNVLGHQHTHRPGQHKMFGSNLACVPRFIMTGGPGTMIDLQQQQQQGYQLQGANDGAVAFDASVVDKYNTAGVEMTFNTYGRYVGLQPNIRSPESLDPARQTALADAHPRTAYRLLKRGQGVSAREFPRSKSAHTVALAQSEGSWRFGQRRQHISESSVDLNGATLESTETGFRTVPRSETAGDPFAPTSPATEDEGADLRGVSKGGTAEDLSLLLLHDSEGRSELSEPLLNNVNPTAVVSAADESFGRPGKLIASAYREASFV